MLNIGFKQKSPSQNIEYLYVYREVFCSLLESFGRERGFRARKRPIVGIHICKIVGAVQTHWGVLDSAVVSEPEKPGVGYVGVCTSTFNDCLNQWESPKTP